MVLKISFIVFMQNIIFLCFLFFLMFSSYFEVKSGLKDYY